LVVASQLYPEVELWTCDEHRIGLIPCLRRLWAPIGHRPVVSLHSRYEWLYLYAFVRPQTGQTHWFILPELSKRAFAMVLVHMAGSVAASAHKRILLVLDRAAWHTAQCHLPEGLVLIFQPPYSPELQPAEHLWQLSDEVLVNRHFATLEDLQTLLFKHCETLMADPERVKAHTLFHWWPVL
jgi:transposase